MLDRACSVHLCSHPLTSQSIKKSFPVWQLWASSSNPSKLQLVQGPHTSTAKLHAFMCVVAYVFAVCDMSRKATFCDKSTYCCATQLFNSPNCWRQAQAMEMDLVLQHSAYALACCLHFCIASCFIRNMNAAGQQYKCVLQKTACKPDDLGRLKCWLAKSDWVAATNLPQPLSIQAPRALCQAYFSETQMSALIRHKRLLILSRLHETSGSVPR